MYVLESNFELTMHVCAENRRDMGVILLHRSLTIHTCQPG